MERKNFTKALVAVFSAMSLLAGCSKTPNAVIKVTIEVDPAVKSTCFRVAAKPSGGGPEVLSEPTARKDKIEAAVYSSSQLSGTVTFVARGFLGKGCDEPLTLNDESAAATETFDLEAVKSVVLAVKPPAPELDADRDGYRSAAQGGPDCADATFAVNPGATEVCADQLDNNCNGQTDCAEPACAGATCSDNLLCTTGDRCQADGKCAGTLITCTVPTSQPCGLAWCNPATGACVFGLADAGSACDDRNSCTEADVCLGDGGCSGATVTCASPPGLCFATAGVCINDAGCVYTPLDAGMACDDGDFCTTGDSCSAAGACSGTAVTCNSPPGQCHSLPGACNAADGTCSYVLNPGGACSDGDSCTLGDTCLADGGCGSGTAFTCGSPPSTCFGAGGACLDDGGCLYPGLDAGTPCSDGDLCTTGDVCSASQTCDAVAVACTTPPAQCYAAAGTCEPGDGGCSYAVSIGAACSDGDPCTLGDQCLDDAGCAAGTPFSCNTPPSACVNATGACLADGGCSYAANPATLYQACDAGSVCWGDGGCAAPSFPYVPSNFDPSLIAASSITPSVVLNCAAGFDSTPGAPSPFTNWCGQTEPQLQVAPQDGGPDAVVLAMYNFKVDTAGSLIVSGTRPVIFAVYDSAEISGMLLAKANLQTPGPGGSSSACGTSNGTAGGFTGGKGGGGGGAGLGTAGAAGGSGGAIGPAGAAGGSAAVSPLRGGCTGGAGGTGSAQGGLGGAGGGAIQLSAASGLTLAGTVSVSGGGGGEAGGSSSGGGGAGSGGALLFEASSISVSSTARITANGGGGGEGSGSAATETRTQGNNGNDANATPAPGGSGGNGQGGPGGSGGAGATAPTIGGNGSRGGGGGGGAVGRIRVNANGACTIAPAAVVSPPASKVGCP